MHRCLRMPEILELICEALAQVGLRNCYTQISDKNTAALAALARTCQRFHLHALDVLWRSQTTIIPLLQCFPRDAWEHNGPLFGDVCFRRPLVRKDWDRFNVYASRIRDLGFSRGACFIVPLEIWQALELSRPFGMPLLLPNLRRLSWCVPDEIFPYIRMLLGPKLSHIQFRFYDNEMLRLSILPLLNSLYQNLTHIEFYMDNGSTIARGVISSAIRQWNSLESLNVESLTQLAMDHIASLPRLRRLYLRGYRQTSYPRPSGGAFPMLQILRLAGPNMLHCASFISAISSPQLQEVTITLLNRTTSDIWKHMFLALKPFGSTLTKLKITEDSMIIGDGGDEWAVGWDCLEPLTTFPRLKKVVLEPVGGLDFNDKQFGRLVSAWPMLEHLELGLLYEWLRPSRITPAGLTSLVEKCPDLGHLGLTIDATECPVRVPQTTPSNSRLTIISVGYSPIRDPVGTAQFLHDLFPQLSATKPVFFSTTDPAQVAELDNHNAELWGAASTVLRFMRDHPGETPPLATSGQ